jgi:hypothetical protein
MKIFAPNAPATYASEVAGMTKPTKIQDGIAKNEKKAAAISGTLNQIQLTRSPHREKAAISRGRTSRTSPSSFTAYVKQISPRSRQPP